MEKLKTVLSLVLALCAGRATYFMLLWKMVQYFIALPIISAFIQRGFKPSKMYP